MPTHKQTTAITGTRDGLGAALMDCTICQFVAGQTAAAPEVLWLTDHWVVVLDRNQSYLGKAFVTLRRHKASLSDLDAAEWQQLQSVIQRVERAVAKAFGADVCNWECLMNNAVHAGQPTHVHWHLYPRYRRGTRFAGQTFPDAKWPRHFEFARRPVDDALFGRIAAALREWL